MTVKKFDKNKAIEEKNKIQSEAVQLLYKFRSILLSWATGCGKTLGSLKMLKEIVTKFPNAKGYIICKETNHLSSWEDEIKLHGYISYMKNVELFLYASLHKYTDEVVDFIILDEVHAVSEKRAEYLSKIIGPKTIIICLSATVDYEKKFQLRKLFNGMHEFHISISDAIKRGLLPVPTVYIHYYKMDDKEKKEYDVMERDVNVAKRIFFREREDWARNKMVAAGSARKRYIASIKTKRAKELIKDEFNKCRYICFCGTIKQAMALNGFNYVHSGRSKEDNLKKKESFNKKRINNLFVVNMFRESMNLKDIHKGLIVQLDNVKLSFVQMLGRVFRSDMPEMHIMVIKDTKDEKFLRNVMKGFDSDYIENIYHYDTTEILQKIN